MTPSLVRIIQPTRPNESYTVANLDAFGNAPILEQCGFSEVEKQMRFYQAIHTRALCSSAEDPAQKNIPFYSRCAYAVANLFADWIAVNCRKAL